jgi:hypothetical protein
VAAAFALLLFASDIVADAAADLCGDHCISQSSEAGSDHEKAPCSHCSCATHSGSVVVTDCALGISGGQQSEKLFPPAAMGRSPKLAASIDHPPQLA